MAAFLLEVIVEPIFKATAGAGVQYGSRKFASMARSHSQFLQEKYTDEQLVADIHKLFGDQFAQQMLDIQQCLKEGLSKLEISIETTVQRLAVQDEYRTCFQAPIHDMMEQGIRLLEWSTDKDSSPTLDYRQIFLISCESKGLLEKISWLHRRLTTRDVSPTLTDDIVTICRVGDDYNWAQFGDWERNILITFGLACNLYLTYLFYKVNFTVSDFSQFKAAVAEPVRPPPDIMKQILNLRKWTNAIEWELKQARLKTKSQFLVRKCGDTEHSKCGVNPKDKDSVETCCELGAKIYKYLDNVSGEDLASKNVARPLAEDLRKTYKQFEWSVVIAEGTYFITLYHDVEQESSMRQQRLGTFSKGMLGKTKTKYHSRIVSNGRQYGQFFCYINKSIVGLPRKNVKALVVWTEKSCIEKIAREWFEPISSNHKLIANVMEPIKKKKGTGPPFQRWPREYQGKKLRFAVVDPAPLNTIYQTDLAKVDKMQFPFCIGKPSSTISDAPTDVQRLILAWPLDCDTAGDLEQCEEDNVPTGQPVQLTDDELERLFGQFRYSL